MDGSEVADHLFTLQGRLDSFHKRHNVKGRAHKVLNWPHKQLGPESVRLTAATELLRGDAC
jgi:hypothetical protein